MRLLQKRIPNQNIPLMNIVWNSFFIKVLENYDSTVDEWKKLGYINNVGA